MEIVIDVDLDENGNIVARHLLHTHDVHGPIFSHPDGRKEKVSQLEAFVAHAKNKEYAENGG